MTKVVAPMATGLGNLLWPLRGFWDEPRERGAKSSGSQGLEDLQHTQLLTMYTGALFPPVKEGR
jgi:hypothetical protein